MHHQFFLGNYYSVSIFDLFSTCTKMYVYHQIFYTFHNLFKCINLMYPYLYHNNIHFHINLKVRITINIIHVNRAIKLFLFHKN